MNDLELDLTHDLTIVDGDLRLLDSEGLVAAQTLKINLLFFEGEWFLDITFGVPYLQTILRKGTPKNVVDTIIYDIALNSYNISSITTFTSEISNDRVYTITSLVGETTDGEIFSISNLSI